MNLWFWNFIAEAFGFAGAILLVWPALSLNRVLRNVDRAMTAFKRAKTSFGTKVGETARPTLEEARVPRWSFYDELMLYLGVALLALSFLIKMLLALGSPAS